MGERLDFDLNLNDGVSSPAKKAADALKKVDEAAKKAQDRLSGKFSDSWVKIGYAAERSASKQQTAFSNAWSKIGMNAARAQEKMHRQAEKSAERAAEKIKENSFLKGIKEGVGFEKLVGAAALGTLLADGLIEGAKAAVEIISEGIKMTFEAAGKEESLRLGYALTLGKKEGPEALENIDTFKNKTSFSGSQIAELMQPIFEIGARGVAARSDFALAGDIAAARGQGSNQQAVGGIIEKIEKIRSKGGVSDRLLTSLKVNGPEFYKSLAKDLHVSAEEAKKRASGGKVDPQLLINKLIEGTEKRQGGKLGTGTEAAGNTFEGRLNKLKQLPEEFLRKLVDSKGFDTIKDKLSDALKALDPDSPNGKKIIEALTGAMDKIGGAVSEAFTPENIEAFVTGIRGAVAAVASLVSGLTTVINLINGETISKALNQGDDVDKKLSAIRQGKTAIQATYGDVRAKQYENEQLAGLSPSEREDYNRQLGKGGKSGGGGKTTNVGPTVVHNTINVHPAKDDVNHTGQKVAEASTNTTQNLVERHAQEAGAM